MLNISDILEYLPAVENAAASSHRRNFGEDEIFELLDKEGLFAALPAGKRLLYFNFLLSQVSHNPLIPSPDDPEKKIWRPYSSDISGRHFDAALLEELSTLIAGRIREFHAEAEEISRQSREDLRTALRRAREMDLEYRFLQKSIELACQVGGEKAAQFEELDSELHTIREIALNTGDRFSASRTLEPELLRDSRFHEYEDEVFALERYLTRRQPDLRQTVFDYSLQETGFRELRLNRRMTYCITTRVMEQVLGGEGEGGAKLVLDAGSPHESLFVTMHLADLGYRVVSIDKDDAALRKERLARYETIRPQMVENIHVEQAVLGEKPLPVEEFDAVFCHSVIEDNPDMREQAMLKDFAASLKPGGFLAITTDISDKSTAYGDGLFRDTRTYSMSDVVTHLVEPALELGLELADGLLYKLDWSDLEDLPPSRLTKECYVGANPAVWQFDFQRDLSVIDERIWLYTEFVLLLKKPK